MSYIGNNPKVKSIVSSGDTLANLTTEARREGRLVYATDTNKFYVDDGATLTALDTAAGGLPLFFGLVVGNATDVANGDATHSTIAAAITAAAAGERITLLPRTFVENLTITKEVHIFGSGRNSVISGTVDLNAGSSFCSFKDYRQNGNFTVANGVVGVILTGSHVSSTTTITDNNPTSDDNLYLVVEDV